MYCEKCGQNLSDTAKFCSACGSHIEVTKSFTSKEYSVCNPPTIDPKQNLLVFKVCTAVFYGILIFIVHSIAFFGSIIDVYRFSGSSVVDLITDTEYMDEYISADSLFIIFLFLLASAICSCIAFHKLPQTQSIHKVWVYAGMICFITAFAISVASDYIKPKGIFIFSIVLYMISVVIADLQSNAKIAENFDNNERRFVLRAFPKHIMANLSYQSELPTFEDFEELINSSNLKEHLLKTHSNNQLYISIHQVAYSKFKEMINSPSTSNMRRFSHNDSKNFIDITLKYSNHVLECEILINM